MISALFSFRRHFLLVAAILSAFAFLLVIPPDLSRYNLITPPGPDEWNYLSHVTAIVYGRTNYNLETSENMPLNQAVGAPVLAAPVVFVFSIVDRMLKNPVIYQRTHGSLYLSWTGLGFPIASQIYLLIGAFLIYLVLDRGEWAPFAAATTGISVVASGVLFYAYRRPVSSHTFEFAVLSLALYLLWCPPLHLAGTTKKWVLTGVVAALIFLVRYNDFPLAVAFIWATLAAEFSPGSANGWLRMPAARRLAAILFAVLMGLVVIVAVVSARTEIGGIGLWNFWILRDRLSPRSPFFYLYRVFHLFFGKDWALVATAPLVLLGLVSCFGLHSRRYIIVPFLLALGFNLFLTITWGTQGSAYGYRYFVPSALPLATIGLSRWIKNGRLPAGRLILAATIAVVPCALMILFGSTLDLGIFYGHVNGKEGWINNDYLYNAIRAVYLNPLQTWYAVLNRCGLSVLARWCGLNTYIDAPSDIVEVSKLVAVWALPLFVGWALACIFDRKAACRES